MTDYPLASGKKDKYFVVLNLDPKLPDIHHALTTSKVERYAKLAFASSGILIPASTVPGLPLATIVDCFSLQEPLDREFLFTEFCVGNLKVCGLLPPDKLAAVSAAISNSSRISAAVKRAVIP